MVDLGIIGKRWVAPASREPGHYLWLSVFGWHDCTWQEDAIIAMAGDGVVNH